MKKFSTAKPPESYEPKPYNCWHCDFSSGRRGMDRCGKCDGTGSVFMVGQKLFPNTEKGYEDAKRAIETNPIGSSQVRR